MMGFGALKYPSRSRTHLPIHSLLCPASPSLQTSGQGLCVSGAGGVLYLSQSLVPSQIPFVSNSRPNAIPWECRRRLGDHGN